MRAWHLVERLHILRMFVVVCRNTMTQVWWVGSYKGAVYLYVWVGYVFLKVSSALGLRRKYLIFKVCTTTGLVLAWFTIFVST